MAINYEGFAFPKPRPRVLDRIAYKRQREADERACRLAVKKRDKGRCVVPGCRERDRVEMHHVIPRSQSKSKRWLTSNNCLLCPKHHQMRHANLITISGNADVELVITGDARLLRFRL